MLVLIDVEISLNEQAASIFAINPSAVTVSIREGFIVTTWKLTTPPTNA